MLTQDDLISAVEFYERETTTALQAARAAALPQPMTFTFSTLGLAAPSIESLVNELPTRYKQQDRDAAFIYTFSLSDSNLVPVDEILEAFDWASEFQRSEAYDGKKNLCKKNAWSKDSRVMYVGRSYKPRERTRQHLSASETGTYALHLGVWAIELDVKVDFHLYQFADLEGRVVQVIEDGLWDALRPLFGRRGER